MLQKTLSDFSYTEENEFNDLLKAFKNVHVHI